MKKLKKALKKWKDENIYINTPKLIHPNNIYYDGYGPTWDTDLNGERYWKRYDPSICSNLRYAGLKFDDIVNEEARIKALMTKYLTEIINGK